MFLNFNVFTVEVQDPLEYQQICQDTPDSSTSGKYFFLNQNQEFYLTDQKIIKTFLRLVPGLKWSRDSDYKWDLMSISCQKYITLRTLCDGRFKTSFNTKSYKYNLLFNHFFESIQIYYFESLNSSELQRFYFEKA